MDGTEIGEHGDEGMAGCGIRWFRNPPRGLKRCSRKCCSATHRQDARKMLDKSALNHGDRIECRQCGDARIRASGVSFDAAMKKRPPRRGPSWCARMSGSARPRSDREGETRDGEGRGWLLERINNVNIDEEMTELAKNQLDFDMASRLLAEVSTDSGRNPGRR